MVEHDLAKVGVAGSNPVSRSSVSLLPRARRRTQVVKGADCKSAMRRFESGRRLHFFRYRVDRCRIGRLFRWAAGEADDQLRRRYMGVRAKHRDAVLRALELWRAGRPAAAIARELRIARSTVRYWLASGAGVAQSAEAIPLKGTKWGFESLHQHQHRAYAYLLGVYLGDGYVATLRRLHVLRVYLHRKQTAVIDDVTAAIETVLPGRHVWRYERRNSLVSEVSCYFADWPAVLPQHGRGRKHTRPIILEAWQRDIVTTFPGDFLRGLIDTDGCRHRRIVNGKDYPAYTFSNHSDDIQNLFHWACELIGIAARHSTRISSSIARRPDVARLDAVMGDRLVWVRSRSLD